MSEHQIFIKCAWRLIPFMGLLYVVSFIDRTNVGFAALTMNQDLGFSPAVFGFGAGIFFLGYALFQVPANAMLERLGARRWVFCITAVWGLLSASTAFVRGPTGFFTLRFLLGAVECGFLPGMLFYLSYWFPRSYRARFTAIFMVAVPLSVVIGGPLSGVILGLDGVAGLHGWQWLFLLEGLPAFVLAFPVLLLLPDGPASASWLGDEEKRTIALRLGDEEGASRKEFWPVFRDRRVLALGLASIGLQFCIYGVQLWLPQIVQAMGFSNRATGFVVALPFAASAVAMIVVGRSSDVRGERIWHIALPLMLSTAAFSSAALAKSDSLVLVALGVATVCVYATYGPFFSFPSSFLRGSAAGAGIALSNAIGTIGGVLGPSLIGVLRQESGGYESSMVALALGAAVFAMIVLGLGRLAPAPENTIRQPSYP
jgi:ACS family tartrate transporter-like MFS transporter